MNQKLKKLSLWCLILALAAFALSYVMFHFLTDGGFTMVWQPEAGKPFVTDLMGTLAVLFLFASIMSLLCAQILFPKE